MKKTINLENPLISFGIPLFLILSLAIVSITQSNPQNIDLLSIGITFDLLILVPFVYFLLIRKTSIHKTTIVPLLIIGVIVATYILPKENQQYLDLFKFWVLPFVELTVLSYVFYNVRKAVLKYRENENSSFDFFTTLKETCYDILPKMAVMPVVTEIAVFYYGFVHWKKVVPKKNEFTYHKESGTIVLLLAVMMIVVVEAFVIHILLIKWNTTVAWVFTLLSIYSGLQLFGFLKSLSKRFYKIENGKLKLHYGILSEANINIEEIESIEIASADIEFENETRKLSPFGTLESHNVVIKLKKINILNGLYGIKRKFDTLAIYVDEKDAFKKSVETAILNPSAFDFVYEKIKKVSVPKSLLTDKQKSLRYIGLVVLISWVFGFVAFNLFSNKTGIPFAISTVIFSIIPAILAYVLNKKEGWSWKELQFIRPDIKSSIFAFIIPFIYFGIQYYIDNRSYPSWEKVGTISELVLTMILGFPLMLILISGEEIGWRGYLQEKLINSYGALKGVLFLGLIWGIWHLPISLQGHNLPNNPVLEAFVTTPLMCIALSFIIAYLGFNSKSIFIGLLLHTSNNHFGGTFVYLTETNNEFISAMIFVGVYLFMIVIFGILYWNKTKKGLQV